MPSYFLDASALAKRYLEEPGTRWVNRIVEEGGRVSVSAITQVEIASAGARRNRAGELSGEVLHAMGRLLAEEFRDVFDVLPPSSAILTRAVDLVETHALRAADAIQLASALHVAEGAVRTDDFAFVSSDAELNDAARGEGLTVLDPRLE
ncbi:MAG: hypothetical protein FLDDKLPJ_01547 [Phycisphaerae bacterium]|nr:hypothetical protein [Phycisphaerae bacterium]